MKDLCFHERLHAVLDDLAVEKTLCKMNTDKKNPHTRLVSFRAHEKELGDSSSYDEKMRHTNSLFYRTGYPYNCGQLSYVRQGTLAKLSL